MKLFRCVVAAAMTAAAPAGADTMLYRYELETGTLPARFAQPLSGSEASGPYYRVVTDTKGAITSVESLRNGHVLSKDDLFYAGAEVHPSKIVSYKDGQETGYELLSYYPDGKEKRIDHYTSLGSLSRYETCGPISGDEQDCAYYMSDGTLRGQVQDTYGSSGARSNRKVLHDGDNRYHVITYDSANGLEIENRLIEAATGKVLNIAKSAYDSSGDLIRKDGYTGDGKPFASVEYDGGLSTKKMYHFSDGSTYEADHHYDEKRAWTGSDIRVNGKLVFRFAYVRQSDGSIIKTQALGLNGELWAEYPGLDVDQVDNKGIYPPNPALGTIYRKDPWW